MFTGKVIVLSIILEIWVIVFLLEITVLRLQIVI
ncbi:hypothetical protein LINPERHAP2_LOCUS32015 [Linum perenne]